ncbi:MAG: hypothetical protein L3J93_04745 [Thermoplasmata archaeon]|nr:hypothetical protein [Thermoplasmata archaeon]
MAKKAKRRLEEQERYESFQFPEFDERKFLEHEYEQSIATIVSVALAILLAVVSWGLDRTNLPSPVAWLAGLAGVVAAPYLIRTVRPLAGEYTKGDWTWLLITLILGWLGLWFLFLNQLPG